MIHLLIINNNCHYSDFVNARVPDGESMNESNEMYAGYPWGLKW